MPKSIEVKLDLRASADFRTLIPDRRIEVVAGTDADYKISLERLAGHNLDVNLTYSGLPTGATASFDDNELSVGESATLSISTAGVSPGTYDLVQIGAQAQAIEEGYVYAYSSNREDVQDAINVADVGDTVIIPAGSSAWSSAVSLPAGVSLIGSGVGSTVITTSGRALNITTAEGKPYRLSGIEFRWTSTSNWPIQANGNVKAFRWDHLKLVGPSTSGATYGAFLGWVTASLKECQYGVIDNCECWNCKIVVMCGHGDWSWKQPTDLGGPTAVYFEDNTYHNNANGSTILCVDEQYGGRFVFRHNVSYDHDWECHPQQDGDASTWCRGSRKAEYYENTAYVTLREIYGAHSLEAGTGVSFNNTFVEQNGYVFGPIFVLQSRRCYSDGNYVGDHINDLSQADGNNTIDGNEESNGYPVADQLGRGRDASSVVRDYPAYDRSHLPQALEPVYTWNNTLNGTRQSALNRNTGYIHHNRDYYDQVSSFNGSSGVGRGTYAEMMAIIPTTLGVGFFCTDQYKLYRAIAGSPMTWELYYTPYTYPHPLRSDPFLGD